MHPQEKVIDQIEQLALSLLRQTAMAAPPCEVKLSRQQLFLLRVLSPRERLTVTELAAELHLSVSATTLAVNRLVRSDYIVRERDEKDRRVVWLRVSDMGRRYVDSMSARRDALLSAALSRLTPEELEQFGELLRKMTL